MNGRDPLAHRLQALGTRIEEVAAWRDRRVHPLRGASFAASPGGERTSIAVGDGWPARGLPAVFELEVEAPPGWAGAPLELHADVGGEALVLVGGEARGALNPYHRRLRLTGAAEAGARWFVRLEAVPYGPFGRRLEVPRLRVLELVEPDDDARGFHEDLLAVHDAAAALARHGRRPLAVRLADLLRDVLADLAVPRSPTPAYLARIARAFRTDATGSDGTLHELWEGWRFDAEPLALGEEHRASWAAARARLTGGLAALRREAPGEGRLVLTGHAHLDLAWLWPLEETRRKARRTFASVLELMDAHDGFRFAQSMAQLYAWVEEDDPALFERVRARVREGRWELVGGMWVEPDGNLPSGEAWVRQLLHGQRWLESRFGRTATVGWLPDTFGYAGNLPQLLHGAGLDGFFTTKLEWNERDRFPHDLYRWEGIDGSAVLAHQVRNPAGGYNGLVEAEGLLATWANFEGKRHHDASLYVYGYGDGGGGPTEGQLERMRRLPRLPGLPRAEPGRVDEAFAAIRPEGLPVWRGEQYFELHRGTYTAQARLKRLNRRLEHVLVEAEAAAVLARAAGRAGGAPTPLARLWTVLLRNQFHDILPGSSVRSVNEEAEREMAAALEEAERLRHEALLDLSGRIEADGDRMLVVWNLALEERPLRATLPRPSSEPFRLLAPDGRAVDWQAVGDAIVVDDPDQSVPGMGCLALAVEGNVARRGDAERRDDTRGGRLEASPQRLANDRLEVRIAPDGTLASLRDRRGGELLSGPANRLVAHADLPRFFEAWEVDADYAASAVDLVADGAPEVVEDGPLRGTVRVVRRSEGVRVEQDYRLWRHGERLEIATRLEVRGRRTMVRALVPLALRSHEATFETAFGAVTRPTHRNTSWDEARFEVPGHRWVDLSEGGRGVALLNDGRYGHSVEGGTLGLTLVRAPIFPDPFADEGEHAFTYALQPHGGDWRSGVVGAAHDLNAPLLGVVAAGGSGAVPRRHAFVRVRGAGLRLAALKPAEEGEGTVLRVYEAHGGRGRGTAELTAGPSATRRTDLLERPLEERASGAFAYGPFEVVSLALESGSGGS